MVYFTEVWNISKHSVTTCITLFLSLKIMKRLLLLIGFTFISCSKEIECVEITRKAEGGGNFYFYWQDTIFNQPDLDDNTDLPSGSVTEEVYNTYVVGDTYCVD